MEGFVLDPPEPAPVPGRAHRSALRERVVREAGERARAHDLRLVVEPAGRGADLAMLWFQGERTRVLEAVGAWDPDPGVLLQIAHAGQCGGRYELVLIVGAEPRSEGPGEPRSARAAHTPLHIAAGPATFASADGTSDVSERQVKR